MLLLVASQSSTCTGNALKRSLFRRPGRLRLVALVARHPETGRSWPCGPAPAASGPCCSESMIAGTAAVGLIFFATGLSWGSYAPLPEGYFLVAADAYIFVGSAVATWAQAGRWSTSG